MPTEDDVLIIPTVKSVEHADSVQESEQVAAAVMRDCSTVVAMDVAGRFLLLETMETRPARDEWARTHFKNRSFQPPDGMESPKDAAVAQLATLIVDQRLVV